MVILYEPFGGLSNNLFQHIHFHSFCKENNIEFVNPFLKYKVCYDYKGKTKLIFNQRKLLSSLGIIKLMEFNENSDFSKLEELMRTKKRVFVKGWSYRNKPLTIKYREYYKQLFFGKNLKPVENIIVPGKTNVGIHIRRGDYAQWQNGKYFYNDAFYISVMKRMNELLSQECHFLIFTNDKELNKAVYEQNFKNIYFSSGTEENDHYLMSCCDYLLGPPSTFTSWASYLGSTKLYFLSEKNTSFNLVDFGICDG